MQKRRSYNIIPAFAEPETFVDRGSYMWVQLAKIDMGSHLPNQTRRYIAPKSGMDMRCTCMQQWSCIAGCGNRLLHVCSASEMRMRLVETLVSRPRQPKAGLFLLNWNGLP